nr:hypothetical protein [Tanacetum cinerariifolium]
VKENKEKDKIGSKPDENEKQKAWEEIYQQYVLFPMWSSGSTNPQNNDGDAAFDGKEHDLMQRSLSLNINKVNAVGTIAPTVGQNSPNSTNTFSADELEDITYSDDEDDVGAEADFNNLETSITEEPKRVHEALKDLSWIEAMNKKDERGIVVRNKARLVAQGHTQEEGIGYEEFLALVARIEAIRLFLSYASFMGFMVYQMDVKSAFLYGTIKEEVYVCQPLGFEEPGHPEKVYKVVKALYGLHQAPRACQDKYVADILRKFRLIEGKSASTPIDTEKPLLKDPDGEDVDVHTYRSMIGSLMYLTSSRPGIMFAVNDITRLQALVDRKNVVVTEATIREALYLDDAEGVDYLPNEEIFAKLARMGYEKPSTKLTSSMAYAVLCLSSGDLSTHTTKYTSPAQSHKVFANMRRVGKGFSRVETPSFKGMLVAHEIDEEGDADEHVEEVNIGDATKGDDSDAHREGPTVNKEQSIPSLTPPTPPPQAPQDIPSTSQVQQTPLQSPQVQPPSPQPQPKQAADFPISLLQEAMDAYAALTRRVEHLEFDKVAQASEITKLKRRVKKLENRNKGRMIAKMDQDDVVVLKDDKEEDKRLMMLLKMLKRIRVAAAPSRRRKGVIIRDPEKESTTSIIIPTETKSKDKAIDHMKLKAKEDPAVKRYQAMKRKPQTEAQARKNMMMYLKNVDGFKLDYFKGMSYDDIRLIFEDKFNSNVAFLLKTKEQIEEDENRALQTINETLAERVAKRRKLDEEVEDLKRHLRIVPNEDDDVYTNASPLARKVPVVDYEIIEMNNKPYYKIIRADGTHQVYISFLTLLRNFDREDLEALWSLVKERFSTAKPKNFSDDLLLTTLGAMFEKPDAHAQI